DVVLGELLAHCGVPTPRRGARSGGALAADLPLGVARRRPLRLPTGVHARIAGAPVPFAELAPAAAAPPAASVVVVAHDAVALTRLCVESVLANTARPPFELIVVDNASRDGTRAYLRTLARRFPDVALVLNDVNRGFAAA